MVFRELGLDGFFGIELRNGKYDLEYGMSGDCIGQVL
jgi:hypothetical protein